VKVETYAVQEPCWTNCLPQLLKSLGYKRAVLKNSTCWGGYHGPSLDADLILWTGPDGTAIPAVPRYAANAVEVRLHRARKRLRDRLGHLVKE
jgi:alpha-mannosidase